MNINIETDNEQMQVRGLPLTGNKKVLAFIGLLSMLGLFYGLAESLFLVVVSVIIDN